MSNAVFQRLPIIIVVGYNFSCIAFKKDDTVYGMYLKNVKRVEKFMPCGSDQYLHNKGR